MIRTEEIALDRVKRLITHAERPRGGVLMLPTIPRVGWTPYARSCAGAGAGGASPR